MYERAAQKTCLLVTRSEADDGLIQPVKMGDLTMSGGPCQNDEYPRNADRAQWAASAMTKFATVTGLREDLQADPETVLADLLADLMHWCDAQTADPYVEEAVDFKSALARARGHYQEELANEGSKRMEDPHIS